MSTLLIKVMRISVKKIKLRVNGRTKMAHPTNSCQSNLPILIIHKFYNNTLSYIELHYIIIQGYA
ncbi:hypothetical protein T10_5384 [Trichinella papuae]|uniref:Uncharacterized protein n=1 Tax=Trichinella papuae TaxID=268474 RepID=A0A0V1MF69_9BILA|nr:hypothetical protein T10_5384 [Trichinella papuae]